MSANAALGCAGQLEPQDAGAADDRFWPKATIRGYFGRPSIKPGELLRLHVGTPAPFFRADFYRQGKTLELVGSSPWYQGREAQPKRADEDWQWPSYDFSVPMTWRTGTYVAMFVEGDAGKNVRWRPDTTTAFGEGKAFFVVKTIGKPAPILYKVPYATYQAYNYTGRANLYKFDKDANGHAIVDIFHDGKTASPPGPSGLKVSMLRPGNGAGGDWMPGVPLDFFDGKSERNTFEHLDAPFVRWLEQNDYPVDYCLDLDVHENGSILTPYTLVICPGHDEYWSAEQRAAHEQYLAGGGNLAFFTGNTCWWQIHYVDGNKAYVCDKNSYGPVQYDQWYRTKPENKLTGVSYRHGGSWWHSKRDTVGFKVQFADHWVYAGTGLKNGDVFGNIDEYPIIGYEVDGCPWVEKNGIAVPIDREKHGTPENFMILGTGLIGKGWTTHYGQGAAFGSYAVSGGGTVVNVATTDWTKVIALDPRVEQITRNIVDRLSKAT